MKALVHYKYWGVYMPWARAYLAIFTDPEEAANAIKTRRSWEGLSTLEVRPIKITLRPGPRNRLQSFSH